MGRYEESEEYCMTQLVIHCPECDQLLTRSDWNGSYVWLCLNWQCRLYREHLLIEKGTVRLEHTSKAKLRSQLPGYRAWLERRKPKRRERYKEIRKLGIDTKGALRFRDMTALTLAEIEERIKYGN